MTLGLFMVILLVLMWIGAFPKWPHSRNWGYAPSSFLTVLIIALIALLLTGRL